MDKPAIICGMDTETTGLDTKRSNILSVTFLAITEDLDEIDRLELFVKPDDEIYTVHPKALETNKIDLVKHSMTAMKRRDAKAAAIRFLLKHHDILNKGNTSSYKKKLIPCGHNVRYDLDMLQDQLFQDATIQELFDYRVIDTQITAAFLKLAGRLPMNQSVSLQNLLTFREIEVADRQAHSATSDIVDTILLLKDFVQIAKKKKKVQAALV